MSKNFEKLREYAADACRDAGYKNSDIIRKVIDDIEKDFNELGRSWAEHHVRLHAINIAGQGLIACARLKGKKKSRVSVPPDVLGGLVHELANATDLLNKRIGESAPLHPIEKEAVQTK